MRIRKRRNTESEELDITSLLDILVILLVFLLKSYNSSDLSVDLVEELALPYSYSQGITNLGVVLQVNKGKNVFVNNELVGNLEGSNREQSKIIKRLKDEYETNKKSKSINKPELINLVFDKTLKYEYIDQVIQYANDSGFLNYKLIVQGKDE